MKPSKSYLFDGVKAQSIENLDQWIEYEAQRNEEHKMYAAVPVVYRCVQLRANAIARVPCYIMRNEEPVEYPLEYMLPRLLWMTEAALCIYGAAYWLRAMNRAQVEGFRWLTPPSIKIEADEVKGLTGFTRKVGTQEIHYTPQQLVYFWLPALDKEIGPGVSPVQAALTMAGVSLNANEFASAFFSRGAIPATLLTVEGNPPDTELRRLEEWWRKLLRGVQRAWETVAVRAGVTVQTIQPPIKDLAMVELNDVSRRQVAMALGVPATLLEDAANYATASSHHVQFYSETIAPECDLLTQMLNEQVFKPQGLEIVLDVNELDVMQADEAERSSSLKQLHEAGLPLVLAMQMLGYDLPEGWDYERLARELEEKEAEREARADAIAQAVQQDRAEDGQDEAEEGNARARQAKAEKAIGAWRRYAVKHGAAKAAMDFKTKDIQPDIAAVIQARLACAMSDEEVKAAYCGPFLAVKQNLGGKEKALIAALLVVYGQHFDKIAAAIKRGEMPDLSALNAAIVGALSVVLTDVVTEAMIDLMLEFGVGVDYLGVLTDAGAWARQYAYDMIKGVEQTQVSKLQQIIGQLADGTLSKDQAVGLMQPMFGEVRARMIAATEITRAHSEAVAMYRKELESRNVQVVERWLTAEDERVCGVCGPLDGTLEPVWMAAIGRRPPAHVNCRCRTVIERAS